MSEDKKGEPDYVTETGKRVPNQHRSKDWAYEVFVPAPARQQQARKLLLMCLTWHIHTPGPVVWPSWGLLQKRSQMSRATIWRHLKGLDETNLITTIPSYRISEKSGGRSSNVYVINVDGWIDDLEGDKAKVVARLRFIEQQTKVSIAPIHTELRP